MFSVGVLYSSQALLDMLSDSGVSVSNFSSSFGRIEVADAEVVLATSQKCQWLRIQDDRIRLTERGAHLQGLGGTRECLREQLYDLLVSEPPTWSRRMIQGRLEAFRAMPDDARQCFEDCDLVTGFDDDVVDWWDRASGALRSERTRINHETGRKAEKLSVSFEKKRTGHDPLWQAVDTNVSGFDVLSVVDVASSAKLRIEVKGSRMRKSEASFFVTRNEWNTATKSAEYTFHLWLIQEQPKLYVVPAEHVKPHIPRDEGSGRWQNAELFYRDFGQYETAVELG